MNLVDSHVAAALEILSRQPYSPVGIIEFLSTFACSPLRSEIRQDAMDLVAIHAIAALVWAAARSVFHLTAGNDLRNDISQFADTVVFLCAARR